MVYIIETAIEKKNCITVKTIRTKHGANCGIFSRDRRAYVFLFQTNFMTAVFVPQGSEYL